MATRGMKVTLAVLALACWTRPAQAQTDVGANGSGNWETKSIWTTNSVPGSTNNVYIGTNAIGGADATATVTLAANELAQNLYLGYGIATSGALSLGSNTLTVSGDIALGDGGTGTIAESGGSFTAAALFIYYGNSYSFGAHDAVGYLEVYGGTATTTATGNVSDNVGVYSGSRLNMGAALNLSGNLTVQDSGSVLNMNHNAITGASQVFLGWNGTSSVTVQNQGTIAAANLSVGNATNYGLLSGDAVSNLNLSGKAIVTTAAVGNVTGSVSVYSGSKLNMGAALDLSGSLNVQDSGSVLNMNNHAITVANYVYLGWYGSSAVTVDNRADIKATALYVGNGMSFNLNSTDSVTIFSLDHGSTSTLSSSVSGLELTNGSTATTTSVGNVSGNIDVLTGSTLNLGAALNMSGTGTLNVQDSGSSVNAQGHGITSNQLFVGYYGSSSASLTNAGPVTTSDLYVGNASALTLHGGDVINDSINLSGGSTLTVQQVGGTGLTFNGFSLSSLSIVSSSMDLIFTLNSAPNWDFRWQDPYGGGNWISTINGMISDGEIKITSPDGYTVSDHNGYTWIQNGGAVPEPSSLLMLGLGSLGLLGVVAARRRRSGS